MKKISLLMIACMTMLASCGTKTQNSVNDDTIDNNDDIKREFTVEKVSYKDSVIIGECKAYAECALGYIKSDEQNDRLVMNVDKWIRKMLNVSDTDVDMGNPLAKMVVENTLQSNAEDLKEFEEAFGKNVEEGFPSVAYELIYEVKPVVVKPGYVTMLFNSYVYTGGAHGGAAVIGQTFASKNGKPIDMNMFKPEAIDEVKKLIKQNIMTQYFKVDIEKDFYDMLLFDVHELPLPQSNPYLMEDGVCFIYQQYEIAPYAAGMPECVIPFESLKPYFCDEVLDMLDID